MITMAMESGQRIVEILKEEPTIHDTDNPVYEIKDGSVEFCHVNFKYSKKAERNALSDIDLHIKSAKPWASSAERAPASRRLSILSADCTTSRREKSKWRRQRQGLRHSLPSQPGGGGAAEKRAVFGHNQGKPALGQRKRHRRSACGGLQACVRRRIRFAVPRRLRHLYRAGRNQRFGRTKTKALYCALRF